MFADRLGVKYVNEAIGYERRVDVCPFCENKDVAVRDQDSIYVHCESCMADGPLYSTASGMTLERCLDGAIGDWNGAKR